MALYRVIKPLKKGPTTIPAGTLSPLDDLPAENIDILLERGAISRASTPPLAELAGWTTRAKRLAAADIVTVEDFLEAPTTILADLLGVRPTTVGRYRSALRRIIQP